jgi:uncharacterized membrane protein YbhN (UPF0104 family)
MNILWFAAGLILSLLAFAIWLHSSEYLRRRKLTLAQRTQEDRGIEDRMSRLG